METFKIFYTLIGGLGIFFYGMKSMSNALQAVAGNMIRQIINSVTTNPLMAVGVGTLVTMIVQSSSVSTVMVIGLVNAGLMKLTQAIGVIFGANIGTTITGWIISIKVGKYGLLFVGMGVFPMLFGKGEKWREVGRIFFGIGLIFMGLETMSGAFKPLRTNEGFLNLISLFSGQSYPQYMASIAMGCLLTVIIQSSSAMLGITIALASTGIIEFHTAAALVLGENIGTTITAILASVGASVHAKRAARAHACFNLLGVTIMLIILPVYIEMIEWLIPGLANLVDSEGNRPNIAGHIAASHTVFNVSATLIFLPFIKHLANFVERITPDKGVKERKHLVHLGNPHDMLPATAISITLQEIKKFGDIVRRLFDMTEEYLFLDKPDAKKLAKIKKYESITDSIQKEITVYLAKVMEMELTGGQSQQTQALLRMADELESVGDYLERIALYRTRYQDSWEFTDEVKADLKKYKEKVSKFFHDVMVTLEEENDLDLEVLERSSAEIHGWANDLREKHLDEMAKGKSSPLSSMTFSDVVEDLRKVRAHTLNFGQALERLQKAEDL